MKLSKFVGMCERIGEIIKFIPAIFKVVPWDHSSIFTILEHWLTRMRECHLRDTLHACSDQRADEIKKCILILQRINQDVHHDKAFTEHNNYWGESKYSFEPVEDKPGYSTLHSTRPNIKNEKDKELELQQFRKCIKHEDYLYNQDVEMLFKIIKKKHRGWWT